MRKILPLLFLLLCIFIFASCGVDLEDYQIVIPENATLTEQYAAENLSNLLNEKFGVALKTVKDTEKEQKNEILIGETNRDESKTNTSLDKMQFLLFKEGSKIVIKGDGIYVGAGCGALANEYTNNDSGRINFDSVPKKEAAYTYKAEANHKNVIFMIGDGMGDNHILLGETKHNFSFAAREFPSIGKSVTRSQTVIEGLGAYTDSAASGTAMSTGYKTYNAYIGLDKDGNFIPNVRELAFSIGAKTAVLTTDLITGATPSAYMCHSSSRANTEELQAQIDTLIAEKKIDFCKGEVSDSLVNEVKSALDLISKDNSRFFTMIEESDIDKGSHAKDEVKVAYSVARFNNAIEYATQFTLMHPDTALIVTADHETGKLSHANGLFLFRSDDHTNVNVSFFAIGAGTEELNGKTVENVELAKFVAGAYTSEEFGMSLSDLPNS